MNTLFLTQRNLGTTADQVRVDKLEREKTLPLVGDLLDWSVIQRVKKGKEGGRRKAMAGISVNLSGGLEIKDKTRRLEAPHGGIST